jgi:23S rRNA (pseudouridine1915-N3)-methyltransferase
MHLPWSATLYRGFGYFSNMKIQFWSVGKPNEAYVKAGIEDFTKRINNYFQADWLLIAAPKNAGSLSETELKKAEAALIIAQLQKEDVLVLLDERGKNLSSPELAQWLQQKANESSKRIVFLIGGAFGVDDTIRKKAAMTWSLSRLVFPHMLVRLILSEQLYRACTILRNEKYHHS